jgi:serine/threonine protein phosphatase PrpC/LysM repeat protein
MTDTRKLRNFEFGNATDIGNVREQNEDYLAYFECSNGHVFIVCDGMGGHVGGATASRIAVDSAREFLENHYFESPADALRESITFANTAVCRKAAENPQLAGMGTTIVLVIVRNDKIWYAHVGDSRLYMHSQGKLYRMTRDHSFVQTLVDKGFITEEEMETHPRRNEILAALGVRGDVTPTFCETPAKPSNGDMLLLCTDGLNSMVPDLVTESVLNEDISIQHKALKLMQLANEAGGLDNITVQLVHFYNVANKRSEFIPASRIKTPVEEAEIDTHKKKRKKMRRYILIVIVVLAVLAILYFVWDMFIQNPTPVPFGPNDTLTEKPVGDTVKKPDTTQQHNVIKANTDTLWVEYTIKSGDVLSRVSDKFNVSKARLMKKNNLEKDRVEKGDKIWVPVKAQHVVASGETIDKIAAKYKAGKEDILKANGLESGADLKSGQKLYIPL